jgi:hypothetical protein
MSRVTSRTLVAVLAALLAIPGLSLNPRPVQAAGSVSLTSMGVPYAQDFNTLATLGQTNTALPTGWDLSESGTSTRNNAAYAASTGSDNAGDVYSFGAAGNNERAYGTLRSGTLIPIVGASFTNNTGATIGRLTVSYTGEMWRAGVTNRGAADRLDFQLSTDATSLSTGTWTDGNALDFSSPNTLAAAGALDGNAAPNRTPISSAITDLSIPNGATLWIRWTDFDISSSDDGLGIDDFSLTPDQADPAPSASSTPANGAVDVAVDANITVTFSEAVDVTGTWFDLTCGGTGAHTAAVSGGPTAFVLDPDTDFAELEFCTITVLASQVTDQDINDPPDHPAADYVATFKTGPECEDVFTPIPDIQGAGASAAITGNVTTQGIVVGDFEGPIASGIQGVYLQDAAGDADPATSDGIFVFTGNNNNGLDAGDLVRVTGYARERFSQTTINGTNSDSSAVTNIFNCGTTGSVSETDVTLPFASATAPERFEGMLVRLPQSLVVGEYFNYDRFGEVVLALPLPGESRPFTGTAIDEPGAPANARTLANSLSRITLDDGLGIQQPSFTRHPNGSAFTLVNRFRGGDTVTNTIGVLGFDFSVYRIQPTQPADYSETNPRPAAPEPVGGSLQVAAMNTLNFFLTLDYPTGDPLDNKCGPAQNVECRGADADQATEFTRQRDKLLQALGGLNADVIGLNELENTTGVDPIGDPLNGILAGLNAMTSVGPYDYINTGVIGTDAIRVGMIYKPSEVTPIGTFKVLTSAVDPRFIDTRSRPALAQTFEENATGERFTVIVNHLKSKGSACLPDDPDIGDGQGNCNQTRKAAAQALVDWAASDPTGSGDPDFLIMGDLNSYAKEDPIDAIKAGADDTAGTADDWTNLIEQFIGQYAYSFVFDGQAGYLDHALSNASMTGQVTGAAEWHINADEPDLIDYDTSFKSTTQDGIYFADAYRSSDHDPVLVGLNLNAPPTIAVVAGGTCSTAGGTILLSVDDLQTDAGSLTLSLTGNTNTTLVPNANVSVGGSGGSRTITIEATAKLSGTAVLTFSLSDGINTTAFVVTVKVGTDLNDSLTGTAGADLLIGLQGTDTLSGLGDGDLLCGGLGNDVLAGGAGDDTLDGDRGIDILTGDDGNDVLRGSEGADSLSGGAGDDSLTGGSGPDAFSGGSGTDLIVDLTLSQGDTWDGT